MQFRRIIQGNSDWVRRSVSATTCIKLYLLSLSETGVIEPIRLTAT